jgi:hypothetical protein
MMSKTVARSAIGLAVISAIAAGGIASGTASAAPAPTCSGRIASVDVTDYSNRRIVETDYVSGCVRVVTYKAPSDFSSDDIEGVQVYWP